MQFFLPMIPPTATAQQHKVTKQGRFYDPRNVQAARAKLTAHLAQHRPQRPIEGPIRLVTKWCWPVDGKHHDGEWKTSRPDTDNLIKMFKDVMTNCGYWLRDEQVASETTEKFWATVPGIWVLVERIEQ